jgi:signal transduction histidine kinase
MKRFTFMDQRQTPEPIDLSQGLRDSVALLLHKARKKSVGVTINIADDVPRVRAIGSDLNQVWTNLIDNAIDAVPEAGHVEISAKRALQFVVVRVINDGPEIPADIRERIFDPFFTTKPVGQGTGLGLEIARRLVHRNQGDIDVVSEPGRTEFRVSVPVAPEAAA